MINEIRAWEFDRISSDAFVLVTEIKHIYDHNRVFYVYLRENLEGHRNFETFALETIFITNIFRDEE